MQEQREINTYLVYALCSLKFIMHDMPIRFKNLKGRYKMDI